jgi:gamma-glutamyltranspeptidase/glutathione hydrolase
MPGGQLHQRYGRLKWSELFEPAIAYATEGVPVPPVISYYMRRGMTNFLKPNMGIEEVANARATFAPTGQAPGVGEIFRNPDLARTYRMIARWPRCFLRRRDRAHHRAIFPRIGGWMTRGDLAAHVRMDRSPHDRLSRRGASTRSAQTRRGRDAPDPQHPREFRLKGAGFQSPLSIHLQAEAKRLAYEDRARYYGRIRPSPGSLSIG